jgi:hypothetical protein
VGRGVRWGHEGPRVYMSPLRHAPFGGIWLTPVNALGRAPRQPPAGSAGPKPGRPPRLPVQIARPSVGSGSHQACDAGSGAGGFPPNLGPWVPSAARGTHGGVIRLLNYGVNGLGEIRRSVPKGHSVLDGPGRGGVRDCASSGPAGTRPKPLRNGRQSHQKGGDEFASIGWGWAYGPSPAARRRPDSSSSRCSAFRR